MNPEQILFLNYDAVFHKFINSDRGDMWREMIRLLRNYMEYSVATPTILADVHQICQCMLLIYIAKQQSPERLS